MQIETYLSSVGHCIEGPPRVNQTQLDQYKSQLQVQEEEGRYPECTQTEKFLFICHPSS